MRFLLLLSEPTANPWPICTALRCSSIRRRRKSTSRHAKRSRLTPAQPADAEQQHQRAVVAGLVGQPLQLDGGRYTLRRGDGFGRFTPRAGLAANIRSRTASSKIRANT